MYVQYVRMYVYVVCVVWRTGKKKGELSTRVEEEGVGNTEFRREKTIMRNGKERKEEEEEEKEEEEEEEEKRTVVPRPQGGYRGTGKNGGRVRM